MFILISYVIEILLISSMPICTYHLAVMLLMMNQIVFYNQNTVACGS